MRHELTDIRTKLAILSQEIDRLNERIAELEGRTMTGSIEGLAGCVTVSYPREWGETVPLFEIVG